MSPCIPASQAGFPVLLPASRALLLVLSLDGQHPLHRQPLASTQPSAPPPSPNFPSRVPNIQTSSCQCQSCQSRQTVESTFVFHDSTRLHTSHHHTHHTQLHTHIIHTLSVWSHTHTRLWLYHQHQVLVMESGRGVESIGPRVRGWIHSLPAVTRSIVGLCVLIHIGVLLGLTSYGSICLSPILTVYNFQSTQPPPPPLPTPSPSPTPLLPHSRQA